MKHLAELKEIIERELEMFAKKGDISVNSLDKIHKLTDTLKNIEKIEMLEEGGDMSHDDGVSYRRGRGRNARRDSMGRYSNDSGYSEDDYSERRSGNRGMGGRDYSYNDAKDHMMSKLGDMMEDADPKEREALKECMRAIERA